MRKNECTFQYNNDGIICNACEYLFTDIDCIGFHYCPICGKKILKILPLDDDSNVYEISTKDIAIKLAIADRQKREKGAGDKKYEEK